MASAVIPGLCCAACQQPFRSEVARRTDDGYVHSVRCTSPAELTDGAWVPTGRGTMAWVEATRGAA